MEIINKEFWAGCNRNNEDIRRKGANEYAERWADLMETRIASGESIEDVAYSTSQVADTEGITGSMYDFAVSVLFSVWKHGPDLRRWHNLRVVDTNGQSEKEKVQTQSSSELLDLVKDLYRALSAIEWFPWNEGHGRCEDYCPRCFCIKGDTHHEDCDTRNAQNKAEAFFERLKGESDV